MNDGEPGLEITLPNTSMISSDSQQQLRLTHLQVVLQRLREAGLMAKPAKYTSCCGYLGHTDGNAKIRPEATCMKITAVSNFPQPKTKKEVCTFLGLSGYYRRFIPNYATLALPTNEESCTEAQVEWTAACVIEMDH